MVTLLLSEAGNSSPYPGRVSSINAGLSGVGSFRSRLFAMSLGYEGKIRVFRTRILREGWDADFDGGGGFSKKSEDRCCLWRFAELDKNSVLCTMEDVQPSSPLEFFPSTVPMPYVFRSWTIV